MHVAQSMSQTNESGFGEAWECLECGNVNAPDMERCLRCAHARLDSDPSMHQVAGLELTDEEWHTLLFAPLWVFTAVAGADGSVDDAELTALGRVLEKSLYIRDNLLRELLGTIARDLRTVFHDFKRDGRSVDEGLSDVGRMLDSRLLADHAVAYKAALFALGDRVARSSGGGLLGIGGRVSTIEKAALLHVAKLLGLTDEHVERAAEASEERGQPPE